MQQRREMSEQRIRDLQNQVVSMRSEVPKLYSKLMKKEFQLFIKQLKNGECIILDKLENFEHWNDPQLAQIGGVILEIPIQEKTNSVNNVDQQADAIRRARDLLERLK